MLFLYTNYLDVFEGINSTGIQTIELEVGNEYTFVSSVSGYSRTVTISEDMSDVYVMPEGALYWYGNECTNISGGFNKGNLLSTSTNTGGSVTFNANNIYIKNVRRIVKMKSNPLSLEVLTGIFVERIYAGAQIGLESYQNLSIG